MQQEKLCLKQVLILRLPQLHLLLHQPQLLVLLPMLAVFHTMNALINVQAVLERVREIVHLVERLWLIIKLFMIPLQVVLRLQPHQVLHSKQRQPLQHLQRAQLKMRQVFIIIYVVMVVQVVQRVRDAEGRLVPFLEGAEDWDGELVRPGDSFITAVGAGTTYPDYKPAPFIVSQEIAGVDMVTVVTEGIFSYCGVKVKIDTMDKETGKTNWKRFLRREKAKRRSNGPACKGSTMMQALAFAVTVWGLPPHLRLAIWPAHSRFHG